MHLDIGHQCVFALDFVFMRLLYVECNLFGYETPEI